MSLSRVYGLSLVGILSAACGAKVVFEAPLEGGGTSSSGGAGSTGGGVVGGSTGTGVGGCAALWAAYQGAIAAAQACDPDLDKVQCDGSAVSPDACGCFTILLNEESASKVGAASDAYAAWEAAGCGPVDCTQCEPNAGNGYCTTSGVCTPL